MKVCIYDIVNDSVTAVDRISTGKSKVRREKLKILSYLRKKLTASISDLEEKTNKMKEELKAVNRGICDIQGHTNLSDRHGTCVCKVCGNKTTLNKIKTMRYE